MIPYKIGQVTKFHTPFTDEDPNQRYVVMEIMEDVEKPRALVKALNNGPSFASINTVLLEDLTIVNVDTTELLGHKVVINKFDISQVTGTVIRANDNVIILDLKKRVKGVEKNVQKTIQDEKDEEHLGTLFVNQFSVQ